MKKASSGYGALLRARNFLPSQMSSSRQQWWQRRPGPARVHCGDAVSQMQCHSAMCWRPRASRRLLAWGSCREWSPSKSIIHILKTYGPPASPRGLCSCHCQAGLESHAAEMRWCPFSCSSSCKASTAGTLWRSHGGDTDASSLVSC